MARTMGAEEDEGMVLNETLEEADAAAAAAAAAAARGQAMPELAPVEDDDWAARALGSTGDTMHKGQGAARPRRARGAYRPR